MLTFLFWNINRKPLSDAIAKIAEQESVDVLILAECEIEASTVLRTLNKKEALFYFAPGKTQTSPIRIFTRFPGWYFQSTFENNRISAGRLALPAREKILLVAVHLPSKLHSSDVSQMLECPC